MCPLRLLKFANLALPGVLIGSELLNYCPGHLAIRRAGARPSAPTYGPFSLLLGHRSSQIWRYRVC